MNPSDTSDALFHFEQEILRQDAHFEAARHALSDRTETRFAIPEDVWDAFQCVTNYMTRQSPRGVRG